MLFNNISVLSEEGLILENRYVGTLGHRIAYIGDKAPEDSYGKVYEGKGKLLLPGFYNAHAHSPMTLLRGYGENLRLQEWLNTRIFPFEDKLDRNAAYWGTMLAMAESMRFGIVSTTDMYNFGEEVVRAILESGLKVNFSRPVLCFSDQDIFDLEGFLEMKALYRSCNGLGDGRILIDLSLHAEYSSTERIVRQFAEYAQGLDAGVHVHVSETRDEVTACRERHEDKSPVEYFDSLGVFDSRTTAAHCVWLTPEDMDILAKKKVSVASCPVSNMKLSSGVCNTPELLARGVNVAIGTDGVASNNSLNFIEEMKFFALVNKMQAEDPTLISPLETLRAATTAGAVSQGRLDCGAIREGFRADLTVLDISKVNMHPVHDMLNNIVYAASGSDVSLTVCDGQIVYKDGEYLTLDVERILFETEKAIKKILAELR